MSAIVNGPKNGSRKPKDERTISSTCSGVATPSSTIRAASLNIANWIRFATNPGPSPTTTGILPSAVRAETTFSTTPGSVEPAGITSTHGTSNGGTNQWTPRNRPGVRSVSASSVTGIDDVFVAITVSAAAAASISSYAVAFTSGRSKTASTTRSTSATAAAIAGAAERWRSAV